MTTVTIQFAAIHCGNCGGHYAIDEHVRATAEETAGGWHCPYCRAGWGYKKSAADRLREQLDEERQRHARDMEVQRGRTKSAQDAADRARNKLRAEKGAKTKLKKRIGAGVCPCCHRTFKQLVRHMKAKHPEYVEGSA